MIVFDKVKLLIQMLIFFFFWFICVLGLEGF